MSKQIAIIVPARLDSRRFPRKLLYKVRGKPIILWTAERIRNVAPEFPLYFAVDNNELEKCLSEQGFNTILTSKKHQSGTDRLAEANATIKASVVINVQGDEPLVTGEQIHGLAEELVEGVDMVTMAVPFKKCEDFTKPDQVKVVCDNRSNALYFSRAPIPYIRNQEGKISDEWLKKNMCYRHLGLYAYNSGFLEVFTALEPGALENIEKLEQLRAIEHGYSIKVKITDQSTVGIDTLEDIAEFETVIA